MKIAVNLFLTSPKSVTGAFVYIKNLLPFLFTMGKENTYYIIGENESVKYFKSLYGDLPNVKFYSVSINRDFIFNPLRGIRKFLAKVKRDYPSRENIIKEEIDDYLHKNNVDVYFSPAQTIYPRGLKIKFVTTVLDLQFEYFPENFSADYITERRKNIKYSIDHSSRLIAISNYTKKSLEEKYDISPEKTKAIYLAPQKIEAGETMLNLPEEFIFYPAAIWKHKNHHILIKALGILVNKFPSLHLICTGLSKSKTLKNELEQLADINGLHGRVLFLGILPDNNLYQLYTQARALIFPSSFEGFGIPLIEAFQLGLPVVAADNSSITEIVNEAGLLIKTGDIEAFAKAIEKILTDNNLRNELIQKGYERAKMFSWEKTAKETLAVFKSL